MSWTDAGAAAEHEPVVSWMQREREDAWQEGFEEGLQEARQDVLRHALILRFGALSPEHEHTLTEASPERLDRWMDLIFTAPTAAALFNAPQYEARDA
jgi:hypothetical protein